MQPQDDRPDDDQLSGLLREWQAPGTPPSLEQRVMSRCVPRNRNWLRLLFTGYIRVPVALVYVLVALVTIGVWKFGVHATPAPCVAEARREPEIHASRAPSSNRCQPQPSGLC